MSQFTGKTNFKEKIDMSQIWLMHINRTNLASGSMEGVYDSYVRQQLRLLPSNMQEWVLGQEDLYTVQEEHFEYKKTRGTRIGTENNPCLIDNTTPVLRLQDGSINWEDPNIYSPIRKTVEILDYERFNMIIMAAAEKAGLSWNVQMHTFDYGDVKKTKKKRSQHPLKKTSSGQIYSDTPTGFDTRIISSVPGHDDYNLIDWHGTEVVAGLGYSPIFFDLIQARTNAENGTIIGMGGDPGIGKTYFTIRLGEILNRVSPKRKFNPYVQIPFTQEHFLWLLSDETPLKVGDVIVLDEAHFAAGSRNWFKEDQKELVALIASARNMGFIIVLVVLHMSMLDNMLRQFTMAFYIHMEKAGLATAYKTFTPRFNSEMMKNTIGPVTLQLPGVAECEHPRCLHCPNLYAKKEDSVMCAVCRAIYERRKKHFQSMKVKASQERRAEKEKQNNRPSQKDRFIAFEKHLDNAQLTSHGNYTPEWINSVLSQEFEGYSVSVNVARSYGKEYKLHKDTIKTP